MIKLQHRFITLLLGVSLIFSVSASIAEERFRVVASIKPIHSILAGLMAGTEGPDLLVGEGKIPYGYELTEQQKTDLKSADIVFWVGPELEKFLVEPIKQLKDGARVNALLDNPELKVLPSRWSEDETKRDPFFWLDSRNAVILVDELARELISADAPRAHLYKRNRAALLARVAELDRRLEYSYRGMKSGIAMAYYDTFQYFEQAYALKIRDVVVESPVNSIQAEKLLTGRAKLAEGYYTCLLTESHMAMPDLPLLMGGAKVNIGKLDSFGSRFTPGPELYFELMDYNTDVTKKCLHRGDLAELDVAAAEEEYIPITSKIRGRFLMVDHNGGLVTETDMLGKYQLIYFGYTFCPDVCPTSLQVLSVALEKLGEKAKKIQPYFITIDPDRDTVKVMKAYVQYFDKSLIGLIGSKSMTERVAKQFRVRYEKVVEEGADPDMYIMDHTASLFLMAPDGSFITKLAYGISADQIVEKINQYIP